MNISKYDDYLVEDVFMRKDTQYCAICGKLIFSPNFYMYRLSEVEKKKIWNKVIRDLKKHLYECHIDIYTSLVKTKTNKTKTNKTKLVKPYNLNAVLWLKRIPLKRMIKNTKRSKSDRYTKPVIKYILKPWDDPESLFCDTEFLDEIVGKKVERC